VTQQQAHKWLWLVAFFALISLICDFLTIPYIWGFLLLSAHIFLVSLLFILIQVILIICALYKKNIGLLLVVLLAYLHSMPIAVVDLVRNIFDQNYSIATVGFLPGSVSLSAYVLTDVTGLAILILRSIGYIKEKRAGLQTSF